MLLNDFLCPKNKDVEEFLKKKAIDFELKSLARTYLILDDEGNILAYFSLSFKEIQINTERLSNSQVQKLTTFKRNKNNISKLKVFLIGQIGKNHIENNNINLNFILNEAFTIVYDIKSKIGGRIVILECENNDKLLNLYQNNGFTAIEIKEPENNLSTLYYTLSNQIK